MINIEERRSIYFIQHGEDGRYDGMLDVYQDMRVILCNRLEQAEVEEAKTTRQSKHRS